MIQSILVAIIIFAAVLYLARMVYKNFTAKSDCSTGCGKCGAIDFQKIEKQLKEKGV